MRGMIRIDGDLKPLMPGDGLRFTLPNPKRTQRRGMRQCSCAGACRSAMLGAAVKLRCYWLLSQSITAGRTDWLPLARVSSIKAFASRRSTRRSRLLTGPIEAGRIERDRRPIAAKHIASMGRPASSPQKDSRVLTSAQRFDDPLNQSQVTDIQRVVTTAHPARSPDLLRKRTA